MWRNSNLIFRFLLKNLSLALIVTVAACYLFMGFYSKLLNSLDGEELSKLERQNEFLRRVVTLQQENFNAAGKGFFSGNLEETAKESSEIVSLYAGEGTYRHYNEVLEVVRLSDYIARKFKIGRGGKDNVFNLLKLVHVESGFKRKCVYPKDPSFGLCQLSIPEFEEGYREVTRRGWNIKFDIMDAKANLTVASMILEKYCKRYGIKNGFRMYNGAHCKQVYIRNEESFKKMLEGGDRK